MRVRFCVWFVALLALGFCIDENDYSIDSVEVSPTIALPLVFGELSIQELLKSTDSAYVKIYPDGLVYLAYSQTLASQGIRELFSVPPDFISKTTAKPWQNLLTAL